MTLGGGLWSALLLSLGLERVEVQHVHRLCPGGGTLASTGVVVQEGNVGSKRPQSGESKGWGDGG